MGHVVVTVWHWSPVCGLNLRGGVAAAGGGRRWRMVGAARQMWFFQAGMCSSSSRARAVPPANWRRSRGGGEESSTTSSRLSRNLFCNQLSAAKALLLCLSRSSLLLAGPLSRTQTLLYTWNFHQIATRTRTRTTTRTQRPKPPGPHLPFSVACTDTYMDYTGSL